MMKTINILFVVLLLSACRKNEDFTLKGDYKAPIHNLSRDLMVVYRQFQLPNAFIINPTKGQTYFTKISSDTTAGTIVDLELEFRSDAPTPILGTAWFHPTKTSGRIIVHYELPYTTALDMGKPVVVTFSNFKNNDATYNGKVTYTKYAGLEKYTVFTDSLRVTAESGTYLLKSNLTCNEFIPQTISKVGGTVESYNGMVAKFTIDTDNAISDNDYLDNYFGYASNQFYFKSGKAIFTQSDYSATVNFYSNGSGGGAIPTLVIDDADTRRFYDYPEY